MVNHFYARPIIPLLISLMGGIALGCQVPGDTAGLLFIGFLGAGIIGANIIRKKPAGLAPIILFAVLGYVSVQPWVAPRFSANHIHNFSDETRWQITGVVVTEPVELKSLKRFVLRADTLKHKNASYQVEGKIRVTVRGKSPHFAGGDRVMFRSRLRQIHNFNNPGGFNYQRYMAFKGIWRTAYIEGRRLQVVEKQSLVNLLQQPNRIRRAMAALIERAGHGDSAAVLKALIIGDRAAISSTVRDAFNRAGVAHVLAISGLHIGIVATVAFVFFQKLLCFVRPLLWRAWTRKGAAIASLMPVFIYGLVSGMSPSTQRAVIMVSIFLMTFLVERERDAINTLALAALIILVVHPSSLFSISFQLSFMAVLSILYGMSRVRQFQLIDRQPAKTAFRFQLYRKLTAFFMASFFAICGTLPLVMFYFNQISVIGLLANFMVVPLVGFVVVPCGLLALLVYPLSSQIAFGCVKVCLFVLDYTLMALQYLADLPFAAVKTFTPSWFEMLCYYVLGGVLLNWLNIQQPRTGPRDLMGAETDQHPASSGYIDTAKSAALNRLFASVAAARKWLTAGFVARKHAIVSLVVLLALLADVGYWLARRYWNADLQVTYIDVGQGSAALLELPGGYTALIDGGGFSDNTVFDMGARVVAPFLWRQKIRTIDTLVLSHPNSDHLNGLIFIAQHFNVKTIWTNSESKTTRGYQHFKKIVAQKHLDLPDFKYLPRKQLINGVEFRLLYPPADFLAKKAYQKWRNTNNSSLVLKVSMGDVSLLFPGDVTADAEKELVGLAGAELASDVLLVPHHGSRSSSSEPFLINVRPNIAVISAGWKNRFQFPHPEVLAAYEKRGCRIFRTDQNGAVMIQTDGIRLKVKPFLSSADPP